MFAYVPKGLENRLNGMTFRFKEGFRKQLPYKTKMSTNPPPPLLPDSKMIYFHLTNSQLYFGLYCQEYTPINEIVIVL